MAATYNADWPGSTDPSRNEIRFRIQDTGPVSFLFQDEEIDSQLSIETATIVRARLYFAAGHLLEAKLIGLALAGDGVSELRTDDINEKFGLSEDGRTGETIQKLINKLFAEGNRLNVTKSRLLRHMKVVRLN